MNYLAYPGLKERPNVKDIQSSSYMLQPEHILEVVAAHFNISVQNLLKKTRKREIVEARRMACYFLKTYTRLSLKNIGVAIGGRDHTTVIHTLNTLKDLRFSDKLIDGQIARIDNKL